MRKIANVTVGNPDTSMARSAHIGGVRQGNRLGTIDKESGIVEAGGGARATARRSTGINPDSRNPIDPAKMPNLPPA